MCLEKPPTNPLFVRLGAGADVHVVLKCARPVPSYRLEKEFYGPSPSLGEVPPSNGMIEPWRRPQITPT